MVFLSVPLFFDKRDFHRGKSTVIKQNITGLSLWVGKGIRKICLVEVFQKKYWNQKRRLVPCLELTYPTWNKSISSIQNCQTVGDMLISRTVNTRFEIHNAYSWVCLRCLEKVKSLLPKRWFDGNLPCYKAKRHLKQIEVLESYVKLKCKTQLQSLWSKSAISEAWWPFSYICK